jgi:ATP-binding cassette subfamily B multidrug efflux pump
MAVVALVLRPLFFGLHDLLVHQTISPGMTSLIRWQNHSYVLKQSLNFFQNDFAGRIAQRIMQTGNSLRDSAVQAVDALWHVAIYAQFPGAVRRGRLAPDDPAAALDDRLHRRPRLLRAAGEGRSVAASDARSKLMGRIVDGYTNITTLKLFAHTVRNSNTPARRSPNRPQGPAAGRVVTSMDVASPS